MGAEEFFMNHQKLNCLNDEELIFNCLNPVVQKVRGKDPETKASEIEKLQEGPRALFMFQVLFGHAKQGIAPFLEQIDYLAEKVDIFAALQSAMRYFHDHDMLAIVEKMEQAFHARVNPIAFDTMIKELDAQYREKIPLTLSQISQYVRSHPLEFLMFEE